ncbi:chloride channel protein [Bacillus timonensis]|uniref:Chloride channel protein n=2 Tax=Bacillus timonensis TaxID=1033734 RepID=A0A4S3PMT0_9BACI|nr:chloride channel protein [Bacillus timonensis]
MVATLSRWLVLATITGGIVGTGTSLFLVALHFSLDQTANIPLYIQMILLPLGGIINGLILYYGYPHQTDLKDSTIAAVHEQSGKMPYRTLPIKPLAAIVTLASGGSAGKEGPCSHIGGTIASLLGSVFRLNPELQKRIVACGVSAGFASVFGTPIAGAIYGVEVLTIGRIRQDIILPSFIAGIVSFEISKLWGIEYSYFPMTSAVNFSEIFFIKIIIIGILCGFVAWLFIEFFEQSRLLFRLIQLRYRIWPPLMPFMGGIIVALLIIWIPTDYLGLSLPIMESALNGEQVPYVSFFWKIVLVAITLGSGFYGGIVTPQFVIGALAGNVFANFLHVDPIIGAAVGMVAVVASASNTPFAAIFMGIELFGMNIGIYVAASCLTAFIIIGHRSVYPEQLVAYSKSIWMTLRPNISLEKEDIHISYGLLRKIRRIQHRKKHRYSKIK